MENCIEINSVSKRYKSFALDNVSLCVPYGSVMGFIGENGAGKSTTIKALLGLIKIDSGSITVMGENASELSNATKEKIGVVFDTPPFPPSLTPKQLDKVQRGIYKTWDSEKFFDYIKRFELPDDKKIKSFSRGMGMRLSISAALAHSPELLVLDEPTGGLDPVVRAGIIDIFREFMLDEKHTILISTHITSDLDRLADYICFIHKGKVIFTEERDEMHDKYRILNCTDEQLALIDKEDIIGIRKGRFSSEVLTAAADKYPDIASDVPTIDEIMVYFVGNEEEKV